MEPMQPIILDDLTLLKSLGKGNYAEVYLTMKKGRRELFATKRMDRKFAEEPDNIKYLKNEIEILKELNHKNVVRLEDIKVTNTDYYLVTEYCNGGTLTDCLGKYIQKNGHPFTEEIVQYLMRQIVDGLAYLHHKNIIHRDLKLDNILVQFNSQEDKENLNMMNCNLKIIDFGFAAHLGKLNKCYSLLGSPPNMDPKILEKMEDTLYGLNLDKKVGYDLKADIYSLGTLCYEMLMGKPVFSGVNLDGLLQKVETGSYKIPINLSKETVSFLNDMLQYDAIKRYTADQLARHHFLTRNVHEFTPIDVQKISKKISHDKLKINIKRNKTIGYIVDDDDENKLINNSINNLSQSTSSYKIPIQSSTPPNVINPQLFKTPNLNNNNINFQNTINSPQNSLLPTVSVNNQYSAYTPYYNLNNQYYIPQYQTSSVNSNLPVNVLTTSPVGYPTMQVQTLAVSNTGGYPVNNIISNNGILYNSYM